MRDDTLLEIVHKLATDKNFRSLFMMDPKETLIGLGLSPETCGTLVAVIPAALALSSILLAGPEGGKNPQIDWARGR